ncbi:Uncharacterised protein [Segatella copri]|nr:Uncharacterised protein [Segatella copri]
MVSFQGFSNSLDSGTVVNHTYFDGIWVDVVHHSFYLALYYFGVDVLDGINSQGVLYGNGCNGRCGIYA